MEKVFASIITIGDELLIGQVIDTNSAWIAQELNKIGISVKQRTAVGDVKEDIVEALNQESKRASIIIITGGLGPTADDITKPLLCEYFGGKMVMHQPTLAHVTNIFENILKRPMIERNTLQAMVPDVCTVLSNEKGTAPGMLFEKEGKIYISLPGVPHEMKWIMQNHVIPLIPTKFSTGFIEHKTLLTFGLGESFLAEKIASTEAELPAHIKLAYLPNSGMVRLRLSAFGFNQESLLASLNIHFEALKIAVGEYLVTDQDITMETIVANLLKEQKSTLSTAESCTGGYIAHLLTTSPGASKYFTGSVVCYDNRIKTSLLQVPEKVLLTEGAVSETTVKQMASAILDLMKTDYSIAVSGIMGPDGSTPEKAVGLVWIAVASKTAIHAKAFNLRYDRSRNIIMTATNALNMLRMLIVDKH
ncbi:MAG: competence/damage-inducible protein A [Bacteroidetes bacterium]|nr:competence/damage-inducible protein A [Bacteroidota bacterium]